MLRSFDALALRQMRTRPLRAALTGVRRRAGRRHGVRRPAARRARSATPSTSSSAPPGARRDLVVTAARRGGTLPQTDARRRSARRTACATPAPWSAASSSALDARGRPIDGRSGQMWVAGFDTARHAALRLPLRRRAARAQRARDRARAQLGARPRDAHVGDRSRVATPTGPRAAARRRHLHASPAGSSFGGQGLAGMPLADGAAPVRPARRLAPDQRPRCATAAQVAALRSALQRAARPGRAGRRRPQGSATTSSSSSRRSTSSSTSSRAIALFVGGFLILNSFNMTVLQRMRELGMLRTLGATRADGRAHAS